jgi:hypothetical protein
MAVGEIVKHPIDEHLHFILNASQLQERRLGLYEMPE